MTFVPGDTEETISFTATDDDVHEDDESVKLTFGNTLPIGVSASGTTEATVSITDDDVPRSDRSFEALHRGRRAAPWTVTGDPSPFQYPRPTRTITDYSGVPANLTFVPGDTEETISFTATQDDDVHEDDESVKLTFGEYPAHRM